MEQRSYLLDSILREKSSYWIIPILCWYQLAAMEWKNAMETVENKFNANPT